MPVKLSNRVSCQEEVWSIYSPTAYVHDILVGACEGGSRGWRQPVYKRLAENDETKGWNHERTPYTEMYEVAK
jgi:hypothetical protein